MLINTSVYSWESPLRDIQWSNTDPPNWCQTGVGVEVFSKAIWPSTSTSDEVYHQAVEQWWFNMKDKAKCIRDKDKCAWRENDAGKADHSGDCQRSHKLPHSTKAASLCNSTPRGRSWGDSQNLALGLLPLREQSNKDWWRNWGASCGRTLPQRSL